MKNNGESKDINNEQLADYAVCPEAWRLKYVIGEETQRKGNSESHISKKEWTDIAELRQELRKYTKLVFAMLATMAGGALLLDSLGLTKIVTKTSSSKSYPINVSSVPTEIGLLLLVLGILIFIWDLLDRRAATINKQSGLKKNSELIAVKGSAMLPASMLRDKKQGLYSKPFALSKEDGHIIPVDVHPVSNKVRDRHVIPLLLHLHLLELQKGKKPPYGILLMGKKRRRVQVANTEQKQRWLYSILDEMRSIYDGVPAAPSPSPRKCQNCDVSKICEHSKAKPRD